MSTRHRWADVITAWAEGEAIQCQPATMSGWPREWCDTYPSDEHGTPAWNNPTYRWRIKPRMCSLNGYEFPAPETKPPERGAQYFFPVASHPDLYGECRPWTGMHAELLLLHRGRVHLSREAAIAHARAEILAVGGTLGDES